MPKKAQRDMQRGQQNIHLFVIAVAMLCGIVIVASIVYSKLSDPNHSQAARPPASVGEKAAPIPTLKVEDVILSQKSKLTPGQIQRSLNSSVGGRATPKYTIQEYQLQWKVSVEDGSMAPMMAQVFVPSAFTSPTQNQTFPQFPVIVYGAGTTGLADRCAPSRENLARGNMGDYRNYIISQASQGYIVVMPNYEGFDNPQRNQHYFNKDSEARSMLSAAKALVTSAEKVNLPLRPNALFFGGYSQGGHAAFSAADYAELYIPDLKVSGVYGHGPTTEITEYMKSNPNLTAYFIASYSEYYPAIKPTEILEKTWVGYLERARRICVDEGFGINSTTLSAVFADPFEKALRQNTIATDFPEVSKVFVENNAGTDYTTIPTMIAQGSTDPVVTLAVQKKFAEQLCDRGVPLDFKEYKGVHHFSTRMVSFNDTNAWIDAVSQGKQVNNSCGKL